MRELTRHFVSSSPAAASSTTMRNPSLFHRRKSYITSSCPETSLSLSVSPGNGKDIIFTRYILRKTTVSKNDCIQSAWAVSINSVCTDLPLTAGNNVPLMIPLANAKITTDETTPFLPADSLSVALPVPNIPEAEGIYPASFVGAYGQTTTQKSPKTYSAGCSRSDNSAQILPQHQYSSAHQTALAAGI